MNTKIIHLITGIILFATAITANYFFYEGNNAVKVAAVMALMLFWWITEAAPIPVTSILPILLFPALGVLDISKTTASYANPVIFLSLGGCVIAMAVEKSGLHKRIALHIVKVAGVKHKNIIGGFMISTAFLSMWMNNTATTVMMLPIGLSILSLIFNEYPADSNQNSSNKYFAISLMLGIAFASSIGGTTTLIGTPPNALMAAFFLQHYGDEISFLNWMLMAVPFAAVMLAACWFILVYIAFPCGNDKIHGVENIISDKLKELGQAKREEKIVAVIFIITALLWIFRTFLPFSNLLSDTSIAIFASILLFTVPVDIKSGRFILNWEDSKDLPWGIMLLFGGGLSLADAMSISGLVEIISSNLSIITKYGLMVTIIAVAITVLLLTEVMSNVAITSLMLPVAAGLSASISSNPLLFIITTTLAASCAFMLPMATPPNAVVFASGYVSMRDMIKAGVYMNIISIICITLLIMVVRHFI